VARIRLYSDRLTDAAQAGQIDVYQYDNISKKLRKQIVYIVQDALGKAHRHTGVSFVNNPAAKKIRDVLLREKGLSSLGSSPTNEYQDLIYHIEHAVTGDLLDALELICIAIDGPVRKIYRYAEDWETKIGPDEALEDINFRLRDAGVGFQFEGTLIRIDSQFAHAEIVKPALDLLNRPGFEGPQSEFLRAHEHYRSGSYKEAINEAAKAFESMMKAVCDLKGWAYPKGARASDLLKVLRAEKLWPEYLDNSFDQLLATLGSGLPKVRNEEGAHGQGSVPKAVPAFVAAYALHLSGAKIILIAEAAVADK
jgi:hypothetical protein